MQFLFRQPSMPKPGDLLPGRPEPIVDPAPHFVNGRALTPPYPDGFEIADVGMGCFWGAEKKFWSIPGVWVTAVGYQGGGTPEPDLQGGLHGQHRARRGGPDRVRPVGGLLRAPAQDLLGVARPDPGVPPGQRHGHAVPVGDLRPRRGAAARRQRRHATCTRRELSRARATGRSRPRSARPRSSTSPRTTTSSTWPRTRTGTTATRRTGVAYLRENVVAGLPIDDMREVCRERGQELRVLPDGGEPGLDVRAALELRLPERLVQGAPVGFVQPVGGMPQPGQDLVQRLRRGDVLVPVTELDDVATHVPHHGALLRKARVGLASGSARSRRPLMGRVSEPPATPRSVAGHGVVAKMRTAPWSPAGPTAVEHPAIKEDHPVGAGAAVERATRRR